VVVVVVVAVVVVVVVVASVIGMFVLGCRCYYTLTFIRSASACCWLKLTPDALDRIGGRHPATM
jgi:hypothetical protein